AASDHFQAFVTRWSYRNPPGARVTRRALAWYDSWPPGGAPYREREDGGCVGAGTRSRSTAQAHQVQAADPTPTPQNSRRVRFPPPRRKFVVAVWGISTALICM